MRAHDDHALRVKAIETLLAEKQLIDRDAVDAFIDIFENQIGPHHGPRVLAHAWADPSFKQRLLDNGTAAIAELDIGGVQGEDMVVVENTDAVHNVVVCTLCSCYSWPTLGLPPRMIVEKGIATREELRPRRWRRGFAPAARRAQRSARRRALQRAMRCW